MNKNTKLFIVIVILIISFFAITEIITFENETFGYKATEEFTNNTLNKIINDNMTDTEKFVSIVKWVDRTVKYDYISMLKRKSGSATLEDGIWIIDVEAIVNRRLGVCADQVAVTHALLKAANINVEIKTNRKYNNIASSHAWIEVEIDDNIYIVDYSSKNLITCK